MFINTIKNVIFIIVVLILVAGMLFLFFSFTLPAIKKDRVQMVEQEMDTHNQTLEAIKQDFSDILTYKNVTAEIDDNIELTISGRSCELTVVLNKDLKVLSLDTIDKTENEVVGVGFACVGEVIVVLFAIGWLCFIIKDIAADIGISRLRRQERKAAKKKQVDVEVLV